MRFFPEFQIGVLNGWIPLVLYMIGLILSVSFYSKESRLWLFNNPQDESKRMLVFIRLGGQLAMVAFIVMMIFTPLYIHHPIFLLGAGIYSIGYILEMSALHYFRMTPPGSPVVEGPYHVSRNPQWLGLFLVLLGSALAASVWLYIGIVGLVGLIYHIQILDEEAACTKKYGVSYREYMERVPRYFLFL
jgi:steroid 5-alpha reductase family enzyme